jgi:hypothetical protein
MGLGFPRRQTDKAPKTVANPASVLSKISVEDMFAPFITLMARGISIAKMWIIMYNFKGKEGEAYEADLF